MNYLLVVQVFVRTPSTALMGRRLGKRGHVHRSEYM